MVVAGGEVVATVNSGHGRVVTEVATSRRDSLMVRASPGVFAVLNMEGNELSLPRSSFFPFQDGNIILIGSVPLKDVCHQVPRWLPLLFFGFRVVWCRGRDCLYFVVPFAIQVVLW